MNTKQLLIFAIALIFVLSASAQPGTLDSDFDADGKLIIGFETGSYEEILDIAIQPDGKIVVVGYSLNSSAYSFALMRFNPDGSLDNTFGTGGKVLTNYGPYHDDLIAVELQPDGKIVCCGTTGTDVDDPYDCDIVILRYNSNGTPDATFNSTGAVQVAIGTYNNNATDIAVQSDGKIVVAGYSYITDYMFVLLRFNTDGTPDMTFSYDGQVATDIGVSSDYAKALAIQPDGKIVVAGYSDNTDYDVSLVRYNADGTLDTSFDTDGKKTISTGSNDDVCYSVCVRADGKIIIGGSTGLTDVNDFLLIQLNDDGSTDTGFSYDGVVITDCGSANDVAYSVCLQPDNKIVMAGTSGESSNRDFTLVRYNEDGTLDLNFNGTGKVTTPIGSLSDYIFSMAIQPDGRILVGGMSINSTDYDFALARYISGLNMGVEDTENTTSAIQIFPNPATTFIEVNLLYSENEIPLAIFNAYGQNISEQIVSGNKARIDVSKLPPGVYYIQVAGGRNTGAKGFVKE